jgi:hypothetical protein
MQIPKEIPSFRVEANAWSATSIRAVEKESIASKDTAWSTSQQFSQPSLTAGRIEMSDSAETGLASHLVSGIFVPDEDFMRSRPCSARGVSAATRSGADLASAACGDAEPWRQTLLSAQR